MAMIKGKDMVAPHGKAPPRAREIQGKPVVSDKPSRNEPHARPPARPLSADLSAAVSRQGPEKAGKVRDAYQRRGRAP